MVRMRHALVATRVTNSESMEECFPRSNGQALFQRQNCAGSFPDTFTQLAAAGILIPTLDSGGRILASPG
jgi:hypothetical protein